MSQTESIRVGIIEDHNIVRAGLRVMLMAHSDIEVVGEAADRKEAFDIVKQKRPDVLLVDLQLGETSALDFLEELMNVSGARSIVVTGSTNDEEIHRSIQSGATGVVFKNENPDVLIRAIRKVYAGEPWLSRTLMTSALTRLRAKNTPPPTDPPTLPADPVEQAKADLAADLRVDPAQVTVVSTAEVTWRDGSLGCPEPGMFYTQALIPGIRTILEVAGKQYHYHSGGHRAPFRCENPQPPAGG